MILPEVSPKQRETDFAAAAKLLAMRGRPPKHRPTFPNRLRQLREERGLSLDELAQRTGMSLSTLQRRETGERGLKVPELERLARALDVPPQRLLKGVDPLTDEQEIAMVAIMRQLPAADRDRLLRMARALLPTAQRA